MYLPGQEDAFWILATLEQVGIETISSLLLSLLATDYQHRRESYQRITHRA